MKLLKLLVVNTLSTLLVATAVSVASAQSSVKLLNHDGTLVPGGISGDSRLKSLKSDLHPGVYLSLGEVVRQENSAVTLVTDRISLQSIESAVFDRGSIEMVSIELSEASDLNGQIDLSVLDNYPDLKYVHVRASLPTSTESLFSMLRNIGTQYKLVLNVDPVN